MGRFCPLCQRDRPNEQFSARGRGCRRCRTRLGRKEVRRRLDLEEIHGFLEQSNITARNRKRLEELGRSEDPRVAGEAERVLQVARLAPRRRGRSHALRRAEAAEVESWQRCLSPLEVHDGTFFDREDLDDLERHLPSNDL